MSKPLVGDTLRCRSCGMRIEVKMPCNSETGEPRFTCCGEEMELVKPAPVDVTHD